MDKEKEIKIRILDSPYKIKFLDTAEDPMLRECDGYCDFSSRTIVVRRSKEDSDIDDYDRMRRKNLRHEIIHAFLAESGLQVNFMHPEYGHDETTVDWIAIQFPKMYKLFKQLDILD